MEDGWTTAVGAGGSGTQPLRVVILGLSITSSWGNGHATTYRALVRQLCRDGHEVLFLERDVPWYAANRDDTAGLGARTELYADTADLFRRFAEDVRAADVVLVGSYVPDGTVIGEWVNETARGMTAFYDIDTPVTLAKLAAGDFQYLSPALIPRYHVYFSFTGGPILDAIRAYGSPCAAPLYCAVDPAVHYPEQSHGRWDLGYMGTYSRDRQPALERLLVAPALRQPRHAFVVAGPQYPPEVSWPDNVERLEHVAPSGHRAFYNSCRFTLNVTRQEMRAAGHSPSVRLFEAAACGTPIISDSWPGLASLFEIGREILIAATEDDVVRCLLGTSESERLAIGARARRRVLREHTAEVRAATFARYVRAFRDARGRWRAHASSLGEKVLPGSSRTRRLSPP